MNETSGIGLTDKTHYRWLLLGAGGQLGREWEQYLNNHGQRFKAFRKDTLDIADPESLHEVLEDFKPDILINAAAYTAVDQAEVDEKEAERINSLAVANIARECAQRGVLLVHYSTDYVFQGSLNDRRHYPEGYPETAPIKPVNVYGRTKWNGEQAIRHMSPPHLILRVSWLCGHHGKNFIYTMLRLASDKNIIKVVDDQYGTPTFTGPAVINSCRLIESGCRGTYHISCDGETNWYEFALAVFDEYERLGNPRQTNLSIKPIPTSEYPTRAARPQWSRLGIKRLADIERTRILHWRSELRTFMQNLPVTEE